MNTYFIVEIFWGE